MQVRNGAPETATVAPDVGDPMPNKVSAGDAISVIIPTVNRPKLLRRAVESALSQTYAPFEVIIVQDGSGGDAFDDVRDLSDPRLVMLQTGSPSGDAGATARNVGIQAARGEWVAFLDDDDEWLTRKLELQIAAAKSVRHDLPVVVSGRVERKSSSENLIWPLRVKQLDESISEYLFLRRYEGEGWLPTPTLMTQRKVAANNLFMGGLRQHEDLDWMLRLEADGAHFIVLEEVIAIVHVVDPNSLSSTARWRDSLQWAIDRKHLLGPEGYSAFCLTEVSRHARKYGTLAAFLKILMASLAGRPRPRDLFQFAANWLLPRPFRTTIVRRRRRRGARLVAK